MSGVWTTARTRQEIDRLADWRGRLTGALSLGASQLESFGLVPEDELLTDLTDYRQRLRSLARQIGGRPPAVEERLSLNELQDHFQQSQQRDEIVRELQTFATLTHVDDPNHPPLERCRRDAQRYQDRLLSALDPGDDEQTRLLSREHALQAVLAMIDRSSELTDEDWNQLQDLISKTYGRSLASAVARGRIRRAAPLNAVELPSAMEDLPSTVASASLVLHEPLSTSLHDSVATGTDTASHWFLTGSSILPGVSTATSAADVSVAETTLTVNEELSSDPTPPPMMIDLAVPKPVWHNDAAAQLARVIAAESPHSRSRWNQLIRQLVRDDRIALAAHFTRCSERAFAGRGMVPSSGLLRALVLGRSLSYAQGELAREVEQELKPFATTSHSAKAADDELLGLGLFQRAAALLPALLGASPSASAVLRSFSIEPGLSHLYNYCSRVAAFGERLQSQAVELFQAPAEQTQWQAERQQLQGEVRDWLAHAVKRSIHYQRCSPLFLHAHWTVLASPTQRHPLQVMEWARWQEVLVIVHRMLFPIGNGKAERNDVRAEFARATAMIEAEHSESAATKVVSGRGLTRLTPRMKDLLLEAIDLANRWFRLQSSTPTRGGYFAAQQAEELRAELVERTTSVVAELDVVARTRSADIVQAGVSACLRVMEHLRQLCAGEVPLALHEPPARHVLSSEFLKMPHVELDENWQPVGEIAEQEQALLEHLSSGCTDWQSAFVLQCHQEDHLATARMLELPVWADAQVLNAFHGLRGQELHRTRQAVLRELDELASRVTLDSADRPDLEPGCNELHLRLERLRAAIPQVLSFAKIRLRLDRYRQQWTQMVSGDVPRPESMGTPVADDSGILLALTAAVAAATETAESAVQNTEHWVFLEE